MTLFRYGFIAAFALCLPPAAPAGAQILSADAGGAAVALEGCRTDLAYLNQLFGWQVSWRQQWQALGGSSGEEARAAIAYWKNAPAALRASREALTKAKTKGGAAPRDVVERILPQIDDMVKGLRLGAPPLRADADPALKAQWASLFADEIVPAVERYHAFLRDEYLPMASPAAGLSGAPGGTECFRKAVRNYTTLDLPAEEIERIGWRLLHETEADLARLNKTGVAAVPALLERLRNLPEEDFTADKLVALSDAAIKRATDAMPRMFSRPAVRPIRVEPMPGEMEASFPAGFYNQAEGGDPAFYVINRSRPQDRRLMAEVIAFHEALPGHHARYALDLPGGNFNSGFSEGWALYSEYLADEMGLYSGDLDRSGMMAKHLWAASRLVIEPGLHLHGWTRQQAVDFMRAHTALSDAEISLEIDRYIAMPGQSLSYMLGYDRIRAARKYAEAKMGSKFDIREFHDIVLAKGSRPLDEVYADVIKWADSGGKTASSH